MRKLINSFLQTTNLSHCYRPRHHSLSTSEVSINVFVSYWQDHSIENGFLEFNIIKPSSTEKVCIRQISLCKINTRQIHTRKISITKVNFRKISLLKICRRTNEVTFNYIPIFWKGRRFSLN